MTHLPLHTQNICVICEPSTPKHLLSPYNVNLSR